MLALTRHSIRIWLGQGIHVFFMTFLMTITEEVPVTYVCMTNCRSNGIVVCSAQRYVQVRFCVSKASLPENGQCSGKGEAKVAALQRRKAGRAESRYMSLLMECTGSS